MLKGLEGVLIGLESERYFTFFDIGLPAHLKEKEIFREKEFDDLNQSDKWVCDGIINGYMVHLL